MAWLRSTLLLLLAIQLMPGTLAFGAGLQAQRRSLLAAPIKPACDVATLLGCEPSYACSSTAGHISVTVKSCLKSVSVISVTSKDKQTCLATGSEVSGALPSFDLACGDQFTVFVHDGSVSGTADFSFATLPSSCARGSVKNPTPGLSEGICQKTYTVDCSKLTKSGECSPETSCKKAAFWPEGVACPVCPANDNKPKGTSCQTASDTSEPCDAPDTCDDSGTCIDNYVTDKTKECGTAPEVGKDKKMCVDLGKCSGTDKTCKPNTPKADGTTCTRDSGTADITPYDAIGNCDAQDTCKDGECVDNFKDSTQVCGTAPPDGTNEKMCVDPGKCSGTSDKKCNSNTPKTDGTSCNRDSGAAEVTPYDGTGNCDAPDTCKTGKCVDNVKPTTTICRARVNTCDAAEYCPGADASAPKTCGTDVCLNDALPLDL